MVFNRLTDKCDWFNHKKIIMVKIMNKILLISISLLIFLAAIAGATAADLNGTDSNNCTCAVESDAVAVEVDNSTCPDGPAPVIIQDDNTHHQGNDTDGQNGKSGNIIDITKDVKGIATKKDLRNRSGDINRFSPENPNHIVVTQEKLDFLKPVINAYYNAYKKFYLKPLDENNPNGPWFDQYELIIAIYTFNKYDDTVIICTQIFNQLGFNTTEAQVEQTINEMRSGACDIGEHNRDAAFYMNSIKRLDKVEHLGNA